MPRATELDLPFLDIGQDWFAADPYPHFAAAREKHPWLATSPFGYLINDYKAIREFFHSEEQYAPPYDGLLDVMQAVEPRISNGVYSVLSVENSVKSRKSYGGTSPQNVAKMARAWVRRLEKEAAGR